MPYYGPITKYKTLKEYLKKDRTKAEIRGLFGFNSLSEGISFEMLQASSKLLAECNVDTYMKDYSDDGVDCSLTINDNMTALLEIKTKDFSVKLDYLYCTDKYPAIQVAFITEDGRSVFHIKKLSLGQDDINDRYMTDIIYYVEDLLVHVLSLVSAGLKEREKQKV